jgi:hypothetical protein
VSDQVSHPYKTIGKIIIPYILIFKFLDSKLEDKKFCTERQQGFPQFNLLLISPWIEFYLLKACSQISKIFCPFRWIIIHLYTVTESCILISKSWPCTQINKQLIPVQSPY